MYKTCVLRRENHRLVNLRSCFRRLIIRKSRGSKTLALLSRLTRIWVNRLFIANICPVNNHSMIRKEVSCPSSLPQPLSMPDSYSAMLEDRGKLFSPLSCYPETTGSRADYPRKVLSSLRLDGIDHRFTSDRDGTIAGGGGRAARSERERAKKRERKSRGYDNAEVEKLHDGSAGGKGIEDKNRQAEDK